MPYFDIFIHPLHFQFIRARTNLFEAFFRPGRSGFQNLSVDGSEMKGMVKQLDKICSQFGCARLGFVLPTRYRDEERLSEETATAIAHRFAEEKAPWLIRLSSMPVEFLGYSYTFVYGASTHEDKVGGVGNVEVDALDGHIIEGREKLEIRLRFSNRLAIQLVDFDLARGSKKEKLDALDRLRALDGPEKQSMLSIYSRFEKDPEVLAEMKDQLKREELGRSD